MPAVKRAIRQSPVRAVGRGRTLIICGAVAALIVCASGCRGFNRAATKAFFHDRYFAKLTSGTQIERSVFRFSEEDIEKAGFLGPASAGEVEVFYQGPLESEAARLAGDMDAIISAAREQTGFDICYRLRIYLFRVDVLPQHVAFRVESDHENRVFSAPAFVEAGAETAESTLFFPAHPFLMLHELTELTLVSPEGPYAVAPDLGWGPFRIVNGTRWFRDGYASYVGFVGAEFAREELGLDVYNDRLKWGAAGVRPLMSLVAVGERLFKWHQFSSEQMDRLQYDASLGLFLVMRHRFGEDKMRELAAGLKDLQRPDGAALVDFVREVTGEDPVKLVEDLYFPLTGLKLEHLSPAEAERKGLATRTAVTVTEVAGDSPAAAAGLEAGDIIRTANLRPVNTFFDIEYAFIESMPDGEVALSVERDGEMHEARIALRDAKPLTHEMIRRRRAKRDRGARERWLWRGSIWVRLHEPGARPKESEPAP